MEEDLKEYYLPYGKQDINEDDISSVVEVLKSSHLTQGEKVPLFEKHVRYKVNSKYAIAVNSATSALHIACIALGLEKGDLVWTSPITFVASANCALYCGAKVDFIDINNSTGLICIDKLKEKLEHAKKKDNLPKIVIPVHLAGTSCDMKAISNLAKEYGFFVIEDASHAIGGLYEKLPVGNCIYSDITIFSFHPVKIITTAEGGIATTNNNILAETMYSLRSHAIEKDKNKLEQSSQGPWYYEQQGLGFNYRMNDIQAALGISQLKRLDSFIEKRNLIFNKYKDLLKDLPVKFLSIPDNILSSLHLAIIRLDNTSPEYHRFIFESLRSSGIGVQVHYIPVHLHPFFRQMGFKEGDFPISELYSKNAISLPIYPNMYDDDQIKVYKVLFNLMKK